MSCSYTWPGTCNPGPLGPSLVELCNASAYVVFMTYLETMIRQNEKISGICERVESIEKPDKEYDFVVIGGGAAGSVVAGRLSEISEWKVLLLEAGPDEPPGGGIPMFTGTLLRTSLDWNYTTTNESYACLANNGSCSATAGKLLGGGTAHNGMIYLRGNSKDYNNWAALGNEGWTWEEVKKFYLKAEDNGEIERVGRNYHATGGPLSVGRFPYRPPFTDSILAAFAEAGYEYNEDLNGEKPSGFTVAQTTNKKGVRCSSAAAYLRPARHRKNLHVSLHSQATKVIIEKGKAVGVRYYQNGVPKRVRVNKEVIVSAGAIKSPHILLLSGIGPKDHLKSVGVKVVKDLPGVGENFHDHAVHMLQFTINETDSYDNNYDAASQYLASQTGPLSGYSLNPTTATVATDLTSPDFPDVQMYFIGYASACAPGEVNALRGTGPRNVAIRTTNFHPKCRGRISLASDNPHEGPVIWGNYLCDPTDVDRLVKIIQLALALANTKALRAHNFTLSDPPVEACSNHAYLSNEYWACAVRYAEIAEVHMAGSCKMGPASDPMAVVDPRLRVYGIKGLRVADASIMPQVTSSNTAAPSMMIGERAVDFVKEDWGR